MMPAGGCLSFLFFFDGGRFGDVFFWGAFVFWFFSFLSYDGCFGRLLLNCAFSYIFFLAFASYPLLTRPTL
jgi:hypothetical protein